MKENERPNMTIEDIYEDKETIIEVACNEALHIILKSIDEDDNYFLDDDSALEIAIELLQMHLKK